MSRERAARAAGGKGHAQEIAALLDAVRAGGPPPIAFETLLAVTRATFAVHREAAAADRLGDGA